MSGRLGGLAGGGLQLAGALAADVVIVRGLAADDAAEGDVAVEAVAPREEVHRAHRHADRRRDLERARHGDPLVGDAGSIAHGRRALIEGIAAVFVDKRLDHPDLRRETAFAHGAARPPCTISHMPHLTHAAPYPISDTAHL